jgi:hypothetical protein
MAASDSVEAKSPPLTFDSCNVAEPAPTERLPLRELVDSERKPGRHRIGLETAQVS